ncbi:hypothetical protein HII31_05064 [Pseudocercospora fuligena]|uniref:Heterokaryon incompatibility domain-containing protein n=1 Tax=Pseudocercospora fuligena TaxID=685502 RepID=A0A8H6VJ68_9PEZI|nr:hypothetical protein HII31_05064 [Pseudocercospora fuligena]
MAHIYEHAKLVTACMGLEAWDGTIASQLQQSWWSDSAQINAMSAHQVQSGLIALLEKKYWSRLWICQELYFARKIYILYGTTALQWAEFYEAYESSDIKLTTYCHMLLHMVNERQLRDSQPHVPSRSSRMASRFFRHRTAVKAPQPTLEELLEFTQEAECADPRDRIYGILKLCEETETITVDYAEDEANLMIRLMKSWHSTRSIVDQLQLLARTLRIDQGTQQSILQAPIRQPSIDTRNEGFRRLSVEWDTRLALTRQSLSGVPKLYSIIDQAPEGHLCAETLLPSTSSTDEIAKFFTTQNSSLTALLTGESAQKLVFSFGLPVAVLCSTARKGDHIVSFGDLMLPPVDASWPSRPVLVLRKDESGRQNEFGLRVIGQGIVLPWAISSARQERDRRTLHIRDVGNELIVGMARFELLDCPTNIDNWMTFNQIPLYNYYEKYRAVGLENIPPERHAQGLASLHSESQGNA